MILALPLCPGVPPSIAHVVDTLAASGLLRTLEWVFSTDMLADERYRSIPAGMDKSSGGASVRGKKIIMTVHRQDTVRELDAGFLRGITFSILGIRGVG